MAIRYHRYSTRKESNLLESRAQVLVNTVNCVGVMGLGIAQQFRRKFPKIMQSYEHFCKQGILRPGMMVRCKQYEESDGKIILSIATKDHYKDPSQLDWIDKGLKELRRVILENGYKSVALPPLGCGAGKLKWEEVGPKIACILGDLDCDIQVYIGRDPQRYEHEYYPMLHEGIVIGVEEGQHDDLLGGELPIPTVAQLLEQILVEA